MTEEEKAAVQRLVDESIRKFAEDMKRRYQKNVDNPGGVINLKKNNCFVRELGSEFMFYSAFVRSFDSSFGNLLEAMGNRIAGLFYKVRGEIDSFLLPEQVQHISNLMAKYDIHEVKPERFHYENQVFIIPRNTESYRMVHQTDNYFYDPEKKMHYIIELKAGGDLDNKKSKAEKIAMLMEYYLLKNKVPGDEAVCIYFATAYNKMGEGNPWTQERVRQFFAEDELLIGRDYWNFVCKDTDGFAIIQEQYRESAVYIREAFREIKALYF